MITQLKSWAAALGGNVCGKSVRCPGPGHSTTDMSLSVTPEPSAPDGFLVHSFSGDDPIACKDYVRAKLGMEPFKPNGHPKPAKKTYFDYPDAHGAVVYQVERTDYHDGRKKTFRQRRPDGNGGWLWNLGGVQPIPYRLPELIEAAGNGNLIVIVEGERKVDLLRSWNIPATCNSGGAQKWRAEHSAYLSGADVVILPDNDQPGRDHAEAVSTSLKEAGATVRVLELPGLGPKGDIVDWAAAGGTVEQLHALIERGAHDPQTTETQPPALNVFSVASFAGKAVPVREWLVHDVIPSNQVTILSGNGGDGKSLLALQLGIAIVTATGWIGYLPEPGGVLFASAEDDPDEIHRRIAAIIEGREDLSLAAMTAFNVIDLSAMDALLAVPQGRTSTLATTELFKQIEAKVMELRPSLLVIDALADAYGGDENVRGQVRQFIALLRKLAIRNKVAVLLIAHPSLSGMATGTGTSGSTGWSNSVRCRLYLEPAMDDDGEADPCLRKLTVMKNNYGPKGTSVALRWDRGRFVLMGGVGSFERMAAEAKDDGLFLKLLKLTTKQGRSVSPYGGRNHAPSVFAEMPDANGTKTPKFKAAMERLLRDKKITIEEIGVPSKKRFVIVEA
jgi:RecA-family ATPase